MVSTNKQAELLSYSVIPMELEGYSYPSLNTI